MSTAALERRGDTATRSPGRIAPPGAPRPARWPAEVLLALFGLGFGAVLAAVIEGERLGALAAPGGALMALGRLAGFGGAYLMLVMVLLAGHLSWLERAVGQDRLLRWHRRSAPWAMCAICGHVVLVVLGYAALAKAGALAQPWSFLTSYPDVLAAAVGFWLIAMAVVTSPKIARRRLRTLPPTSTVPTPTVPATASATGALVNHNYGILSVSVTVSGGKLTHIGIATLDDGGNFRSQAIEEQPIPILEREALQAQSANIQAVARASDTSAGFAQSLRSARSELGR